MYKNILPTAYFQIQIQIQILNSRTEGCVYMSQDTCTCVISLANYFHKITSFVGPIFLIYSLSYSYPGYIRTKTFSFLKKRTLLFCTCFAKCTFRGRLKKLLTESSTQPTRLQRIISTSFKARFL